MVGKHVQPLSCLSLRVHENHTDVAPDRERLRSTERSPGGGAARSSADRTRLLLLGPLSREPREGPDSAPVLTGSRPRRGGGRVGEAGPTQGATPRARLAGSAGIL